MSQFERFVPKMSLTQALAALWFFISVAPLALAEEEADDFNILIPLAQRPHWTGDLDELMDHRQIRVLVPFSKLNAYFDGPRLRGMAVDSLQHFETYLNKELNTGNLRVPVVIIPVLLDEAVPALVAGYGDMIAGTFSVTDERSEEIDFTNPTTRSFSEIVVTSPNIDPLTSFDQLAAVPVYVRKSSSYYGSLMSLNRQREAQGKRPIELIEADEYLETADILEMVNAGVFNATVADEYLVNLWSNVYPGLQALPELAVATDRRLAWATRKNSPQLIELINGFIEENRQGTLFGNIIINRYLKGDRWIHSVTSEQDLSRFNQAARLFKKYADQYDFDWLMIAAQAYQESGIDQSKSNPSGAVGVMQIKPATAGDMGIENVHDMELNIHAGVKYLRWIVRNFFDDPEVDEVNKTLLAFASYNAGPSRIARIRRETKEGGFDPNVWFRNVEIFAARDIGRETVQYVSNIYKYYVTYRVAVDADNRRKATTSESEM